jgi:hypothetical protein
VKVSVASVVGVAVPQVDANGVALLDTWTDTGDVVDGGVLALLWKPPPQPDRAPPTKTAVAITNARYESIERQHARTIGTLKTQAGR